MAPREGRVETSRPALMSPESAKRLLTAEAERESRSSASTPVRRSPETKATPPTPATPDLPLAGVSAAQQAEVLEKAAESGAPVCEECRKNANEDAESEAGAA